MEDDIRPVSHPAAAIADALAAYRQTPTPETWQAIYDLTQEEVAAPEVDAVEAWASLVADPPQREDLPELLTKAGEALSIGKDEQLAYAVRQLARYGYEGEDAAKARAVARRELEMARPLNVSTERNPAPPPQLWLVQNWLPADRLAMLTGIGGAGKSRLALQLAAAVAAGQDVWLYGTAVKGMENNAAPDGPAIVVWASWEDGPDEIDRRLKLAAEQRAPDKVNASWCTPRALGDRLVVVGMADREPIWGPKPGAHVSTAARLLPPGEQLLELAADKRAALLVIDPIAAAYGSNENDRALVRAFGAALDSWAREHVCTVLLIGHPPKSGADPYSGSTDWRNAVRSMWTLTKEKQPKGTGEDDNRPDEWKLTLDKANYAPSQPPRLLRRHPEGQESRYLDDTPPGFWRAYSWGNTYGPDDV